MTLGLLTCGIDTPDSIGSVETLRRTRGGRIPLVEKITAYRDATHSFGFSFGYTSQEAGAVSVVSFVVTLSLHTPQLEKL